MTMYGDRRLERTSPAGLGVQALCVALFFLWGVANNLNDVLIAHFRVLFSLGDFQSGFVQSAFYLGYFCFSIPAALVMRRYGYKTGVVVGLLLFALGAMLFWPASYRLTYDLFLGALFVMASGLAFLETAANPMITVLGPQETAAWRLTLAQAFNPLGSMTGVALGATFILSVSGDAQASRLAQAAAVRMPYLLIAIVGFVWAGLIACSRFPEIATRGSGEGASASSEYWALLRQPRYLAGVGTQFAYVGAQVGVWSFLIRYTAAALPGVDAQHAAWLLTLSLGLFMIGRFVGAALTTHIPAARIMFVFALANILLCLVAVLLGGWAGVLSLVLSSAFMSVMYPTIFVLSLRDLGALTKAGSSLIVMAIIGGAVLTALMGFLSDLAGTIRAAMIVPAACFAVVALFARLHAGDGRA